MTKKVWPNVNDMGSELISKMAKAVSDLYYVGDPSAGRNLWGDPPPMTPERQAELDRWEAKQQALADEQKRLWESLPGKTLSGIERDENDELRLNLTFADGTTVKIQAYVSEDGDLDVEIEPPKK